MKRIVITVVVDDDEVIYNVELSNLAEALVDAVRVYTAERYEDVEVSHTVETLW